MAVMNSALNEKGISMDGISKTIDKISKRILSFSFCKISIKFFPKTIPEPKYRAFRKAWGIINGKAILQYSRRCPQIKRLAVIMKMKILLLEIRNKNQYSNWMIKKQIKNHRGTLILK